MALHSINPATGELLRSFPVLHAGELEERIAQSSRAFGDQRDSPAEHRALCLRKLAHLLTEEAEPLARLIVLETGKPVTAARAEITRCAAACRFYAEHAARLLAPELLPGEQAHAYTQWRAVGVLLAVLSWRSPFWQSLRFAAPALLAGNAVLLKHAASVPQCALAVERLIRQAGFPRGALTSLLIDEGLVETVLNHGAVAAVLATGTPEEGRALAAQAGWLMKECVLQLQGSSPMIVMPSADLDAAVEAATLAIAGGEGEACRIVVHEQVCSAVQQQLTGRLDGLRIGDPGRESTEVGPLGTALACETLARQVAAAVASGGRILTGGTRMVGGGHFFEPTLLNDVPVDAAVAAEPISGPAAMLFRARDLPDAIRIANQVPGARSASVWTRQPAEQQLLLDEVQAAAVTLNALPHESLVEATGLGGVGVAALRPWMRGKTVVLPAQVRLPMERSG